MVRKNVISTDAGRVALPTLGIPGELVIATLGTLPVPRLSASRLTGWVDLNETFETHG